MRDTEQRQALAARIMQRRRALAARSDVSQRMRDLSRSGIRQPIAPRTIHRPSRSSLLVGGALVALLAICVVATALVVASQVWLQSQTGAPTVVVDQFYAALHERDYAQAYSYFSSAARRTLSEAAFTQQEQSFDQIDGVVESYTAQRTSTTSAGATVVMRVTRQALDQPQTDTLTLVRENGAWRVSALSIGP